MALGIIKKWSDTGLAIKILVCMALGIILGLILHQMDRPLDLANVKSIPEQLQGAGVTADQLATVDANSDGLISSDELKSLSKRDDLNPTTQASVAKISKINTPTQRFLQSEMDGIGLLKKFAGDDGQLDRNEVAELKLDEVLSTEGARAAKALESGKSSERIRSGVGLNIAQFLALAGDLFLGLIKTVVIPLVFIAVFVGIAGNEDLETVKRVGGGILLYFLITTFVSVSIGSTLAVLIGPGNGFGEEYAAEAMVGAEDREVPASEATLRDKVQSFIPKNIFGSLSVGNTLDVVLFAALFGAVILILRQGSTPYTAQANTIVKWFEFFLEICMTVVRWAMYLAPIGVFGLMAHITAEVGLEAITSVSKYAMTVVLGLILLLVFYSIIVLVVGKRSPISFFKSIYPLQMLAFSTSSSAAVMPTSIETAEQKLGINRGIVRFTIPLGATINMDGTALYQAVAAIFLMQVFGMPVTFAAISLILVTAILASVGTPGTPGVGIVVLAGILESNGVPASGVAIILGVDRLLDMFRTAINVTGDQTACIVMERIAGKKLDNLETAES